MTGTNVPEVTMEGDTVIYRQDFAPSPLSPLFCAGMGFEDGKVVKREQEGRMPSLAVSFSDWKVHDIDAGPGARVDYLMRGAHIVTPSQRGKNALFFGVPPSMCRAYRLTWRREPKPVWLLLSMKTRHCSKNCKPRSLRIPAVSILRKSIWVMIPLEFVFDRC